MTKLSVNLNKIALLRNSRGRDFPNVVDFAKKFLALGVDGVTIHPRQDQRHITVKDAQQLGVLFADLPQVELNIEGYPSNDFLALVESIKPTQCTLVPDEPNQLTSDHGWDLTQHTTSLSESIARLKRLGIRVALFLDPDVKQVQLVPDTGADRIELYTERYAAKFTRNESDQVLTEYKNAAAQARALNIGVNAGHDLDLQNLSRFLSINGVLEVSIGHALMIECIEMGMSTAIQQYLNICR